MSLSIHSHVLTSNHNPASFNGPTIVFFRHCIWSKACSKYYISPLPGPRTHRSFLPPPANTNVHICRKTTLYEPRKSLVSYALTFNEAHAVDGFQKRRELSHMQSACSPADVAFVHSPFSHSLHARALSIQSFLWPPQPPPPRRRRLPRD